MSFSGLILTNLGRNELAKAEMGEIFSITHIVLGDGNYSGAITSIKEMVNPIMTLPVSKIERDNGEVILECDFNSTDVPRAFYWREIGIIANDTLCYYDNSREDAEYIDPDSDKIIRQKRMRVILLLSSDIQIQVSVPSRLYAMDEDMQKVLNPVYESSENLAELESGESIFTTFGKISKAVNTLISHTGNKSNPHGVTKTQVGLGNVPNVSTNDQAPVYAESLKLESLQSGEKLSVAFGKLSKAVNTLINHIDKRATVSQQGHVKISSSSAVTDTTGLALAATEKNAAIEGTLANEYKKLNESLNTFESAPLDFVGAMSVTASSAVKNGHIVFASFEFKLKQGYPFNGKAQIAQLPYAVKHASYGGIAWIASSNTFASIYASGSALYMQSNVTIQEGEVIRGSIFYFT